MKRKHWDEIKKKTDWNNERETQDASRRSPRELLAHKRQMGLAQYKVQRVCVYLSIIANSTNQYNVWFSPCKVMSLPQLHLSWRSTKYWQILQTCQSECKLVEVIHTLFRSDEGGKGFCWNSGSMCAAWWHPLCLGFPPIHHLGAAKICQKFEHIVIFLGHLLYLRCFAW